MFTTADVPKDIRTVPKDMERVSARMNLNTGSIIVKRRESEYGDYGETLMHTPGPVVLVDAEFNVQDKAHEKVVENGTRNVCAYAVGKYVRRFQNCNARDQILRRVDSEGESIRYNPFRSKYFTAEVADDHHVPVEQAKYLVVWSKTVGGEAKGRMKGFEAIPHNDVL